MKLKKLIAGVLVTVMACAAAMSPAGAYFTANVDTENGKPYLFTQTELKEIVTDHKEVTVVNTGEVPVQVRARAYVGAEYADLIEYSTADGSWHDGGDGWWYYNSTLQAPTAEVPAPETTPLLIKVDLPTEGDTIEEGDVINVVVVYEAIELDRSWNSTEAGA